MFKKSQLDNFGACDQAWSLFDDSGNEDNADQHIITVSEAIGPQSASQELAVQYALDDVLLARVICTAGDTLTLLKQQVPAVCRRFQQILQNERQCWQRLSLLPPFQIPCSVVTDELVCRLVRAHGHQLLHVHLDGARLLGPAAVSNLAHHCPALKSATLVGCIGVGSAPIRFLSRSCPQLEVLRVAGCAAADIDQGVDEVLLENGAADAAVRAMATSCPLLRSVSLSSLRSDFSISELLKGCPNLTILDLAGCQRLPCTEELLKALAAKQCTLESLKLGDCIRLNSLQGLGNFYRLRILFLGGCSRLSDAAGLGDLLAGCADVLEFLSLVGCHGLSAAGLCTGFAAAKSLIALQTLVLGGCRVNDAVCEIVSDACPSLTALDLWNCFMSDAGVDAILRGGAPLSQVNLRECVNVSGAAVAAIGMAPHITGLHTLDVACVGTILDQHLLPVLKQHTGALTSLNCGGSNCMITGVCLQHLPPALTVLDLAECKMVWNLLPVSQLGHLSSLSLDGCDVQLDALVDVCRACPLTALNVAASSIDDAMLANIVSSLPRLLHLELRACSAVTDVGVEAVVDHCKQLVLLGLGGCAAISSCALTRAAMALPACEIVHDAEVSIPGAINAASQ